MSLSQHLQVLGAAVQPEELQHGEVAPPRVELCPRLRSTYSPRLSWTDPEGPGGARAGGTPAWARVWDYGPTAEALGLSLAPNSNRPSRYGLSGLPAAGRRQVWRALALLEEMRPLLSFWTVSLPTAALLDLNERDTWALFQDRVRKLLARKLRGAGLPDLVVGVVELQPRRSRATGIPCPHLHVVFQGRKSRGAHWALSPGDLDGVIAAGLATAGVALPAGIDGEAFLKSAGNVQQVRKSVQAYLSKYMTKGGNDTAPHVGGSAENLLPRQWWFWTRALRSWVLEHVFPLAFPFLCWVHARREELQELGLIRLRVLDLPDPRAPLTYEVNWLSTSHLAELVGAWQDDQWDADWHRNFRLSRWRHYRSQTSLATSTALSAWWSGACSAFSPAPMGRR